MARGIAAAPLGLVDRELPARAPEPPRDGPQEVREARELRLELERRHVLAVEEPAERVRVRAGGVQAALAGGRALDARRGERREERLGPVAARVAEVRERARHERRE